MLFLGSTSWCFFNKAKAQNKKPPTHNNMPIFLNEKVVEHIRPIYERLSDLKLLSNCSRGLTQNSNEALHGVLWRRCPKITFVSKKKIDIAAASAIAEFNMGAERSAKCIDQNQLNLHSDKILKAKDQKRKRMSDYKSEPEIKKRRIDKRYNQIKSGILQEKSEGVTYAKGKFHNN